MINFKKTGYNTAVIASIVLLVWIGYFKFTPTEAMAIKPYVSNSFLMNWMYKIGSVQAVSNFIGIIEITTGLLLIASFWSRHAGLIAGYLGMIIFLTTLSFLITTPGAWKVIDGVFMTDAFVLKDIGYLGISFLVIGHQSKSDVAVKLSR